MGPGRGPKGGRTVDLLSCIGDLLEEVLRRLEVYPSHSLSKSGGDRASHSLRTSFLAFTIARLFRADAAACARAALLHDIGYRGGESILQATLRHAERSARIAERLGEPKLVVEAIRDHMFPIAGGPPRSLEAVILWFSDKLDAVLELLGLSGPLERVARRLVEGQRPRG